MRWVLELPLFVILMGAMGLLMFVPMGFALSIRDWLPARVFFYSGFLTLLITSLIAAATWNRRSRNLARNHLLTLAGTFSLLPLILAVPLYESVRDTTFINAYLEMVSCLTTTGATLFAAERLSPAVHLWRAIVGWTGGYFMWVAAIAILAPMNLGGFEVTSSSSAGSDVGQYQGQGTRQAADARFRLARFAWKFLPLYAGLTLVLWFGLLTVGEAPLTAIIHAMSTLATSGISPVGGLENAQSGIAGEMVIFAFFAFAISRRTFAADFSPGRVTGLGSDPEARIGLFLVILVPTVLFLRHWVGAYEVDEEADLSSALLAFWGSMFSVLSFLTTTGFESAEWATARAWSGLQTPGVILLGLALIGGGVATTAGGVKLMRVYALYKHGLREMERLVHPSSMGGSGVIARRIRRQGAYIAWIFFMLFAVSLAAITLAFTAAGLSFEEAIILSVAGLSTTGPVATVALDTPIDLNSIPSAAKLILSLAMVVGRLEALAIIALLNPEFWRR